MRRRPALTIALTALVFLLSTSTGAVATPASTQTDLDILGTSNGNEERSHQLTAEVNDATRNESGNLLSITWSISNSGNEDVILTWLSDQSYIYSGPTFSGVIATSENGTTQFHPVMDGDGFCLCSGEYSAQLQEIALANETVTYWSLFSVPSDLESVTIEIPGFEPIEDVPIS